MKNTLIKIERLSKSFSSGGAMQHVLKNIDLELYKGDFTVIMGASGAGKSTLLYALSGMDTPTLGKITFGDKVITDLSSDGLALFRKEHCGFVFQQIYLIDTMSVLDNVLAAGLLVSDGRRARLYAGAGRPPPAGAVHRVFCGTGDAAVFLYPILGRRADRRSDGYEHGPDL